MLKKFLKFIKLHTRIIFALLIISISGLFIMSRNNSNLEDDSLPESRKEVQVYSPNSSYIESIGEVIESGKIEIKAQAGGVIRRVNTKPSQKVYTGTNILEISQSYSSSSPALTQAAIAEKQYNLAKDTYEEQIQAIAYQKSLAELNAENAYEQRRIAEASLNDTNKLVEDAESSLSNLKNANTNGQLDEAISGLEASLTQLKATQRNLSYSANNNEPQAKLSEVSRDLTIKQLDIQEKSLEVQLEISKLSSITAHQSAATFLPSSPVSGVVEAIYVGENQVVSPGQILAVVSGNSKTKITTFVATNIYEYIDIKNQAVIEVNGNEISAFPTYISDLPTKGFLHTVTFELSDIPYSDSKFVRVKLPYTTQNHSKFLVPLESLHQTQNNNYLYVVENDEVIAKEVEIGAIQGSYVEIKSGVESKERIITTRNVAAGDKVTITN